MVERSDQVIHGRPFEVVEPKLFKHVKYRGPKPHARIHVDGLNKKDGTSIRFHSVKSAQNHIENFRLSRGDSNYNHDDFKARDEAEQEYRDSLKS